MMRSTAPVVFLALFGSALFGFASAPALAASPCGNSVVVQPGDTLSRIADRCDVSEAALLDANPKIHGSGDLQVGSTLQINNETLAQQLGRKFDQFGQEATDALNDFADKIGSSVQDILDRNPKVKMCLDELGSKLGLNDNGSKPTMSITPQSGPPGSTVRIFAQGLPKDTPVEIGVGPRGSAFELVQRARTSNTGTLETEVTVPQQMASNSIRFVIKDANGVEARSDAYQITP